jgi:IS5 family transposase
MGLLAQTAEPAKEVLGVEQIAVVADRGYFKIEDIEACEKAGIDPYVPRPQHGPPVRAGRAANIGFVGNTPKPPPTTIA